MASIVARLLVGLPMLYATILVLKCPCAHLLSCEWNTFLFSILIAGINLVIVRAWGL